MLLPAEYKDAAARICISAVQQFGLFQFAARAKASVIQCLTLPSCLPGSSKPLLLKNTRNYLSKKTSLAEPQQQSATSVGEA